jgi:hypothetical protein
MTYGYYDIQQAIVTTRPFSLVEGIVAIDTKKNENIKYD